MRKFLFFFIFLSVLFLPVCSAAHYIAGMVENAKDGTEANGHTILLWNPAIGIQDNISDIIGLSGNSQADNIYMIDCELLEGGCNINDTLSLKVINNGDNYVSEERKVNVSGWGYDIVDSITLNSPPTTTLIFPGSLSNISDSSIIFNCSVSDLDNNLIEVSLYGNWTGEWVLNETKEIISNGFTTFTKNIGEGLYLWACKTTDNLSISSFSSQNNTFTLDYTKPVIESVLLNISQSPKIPDAVRVNCTTYDETLAIEKVIIQAISPSQIKDYTASLLAGETYYSDIQLDESGNWTFNCISNDTAGNINNLTSGNLQVSSGLPDLFITSSGINLNESNPMENQSVIISALVENIGSDDAKDVLISFFDGNPANSGKSIGNISINISRASSSLANLSWKAKIGANNIFVFADYWNLTNEDNKSNNWANRTFSIGSWQYIYGNVTIDKIIGDNTTNIRKWFNESSLVGNIFITDSECSVNWLSLQAIGKNKEGGESSQDFLEIDELLNMVYFEDSVSQIFSNNQNPRETGSILVHQKEIKDVPIINSTNNSNFVTGILWDTSDDTNGTNGEFDLADKEDIVFISPINKQVIGSYGTYDYEVRIPSKLREYNNLDSKEIYLYYDLN
jgi:hypothetical protein